MGGGGGYRIQSMGYTEHGISLKDGISHKQDTSFIVIWRKDFMDIANVGIYRFAKRNS